MPFLQAFFYSDRAGNIQGDRLMGRNARDILSVFSTKIENSYARAATRKKRVGSRLENGQSITAMLCVTSRVFTF